MLDTYFIHALSPSNPLYFEAHDEAVTWLGVPCCEPLLPYLLAHLQYPTELNL